MGIGLTTSTTGASNDGLQSPAAPREVDIGIQLGKGPLESVRLTPERPYRVGNTTVSLDASGRVVVQGSDRGESFQIMNGSELGMPGSVVVGVESPGARDVYLRIPEQQAAGLVVNGGGGRDDYHAPIDGNDRFVRIDDVEGNNWVTNIGTRVTGRVSVADNQREGLRRHAGGLSLERSGQTGAPPEVESSRSFIDAFLSWLSSLFR